VHTPTSRKVVDAITIRLWNDGWLGGAHLDNNPSNNAPENKRITPESLVSGIVSLLRIRASQRR
jgi:hypothetical protein